MSQLSIFRGAIASSFTALMLISCQTSDLGTSSPTQEPLSNVQKSATNPKAVQGLTHGPIVNIDGEDYYLAGVPDGMNGATDIPGHYWRRTGDNALIGKHFNTGLFGKAKWWNSSVPDGALLYIVNGGIAEWSMKISKEKAKMGFVHYHEFVRVSDGKLHPTKVLWLQHIAVRHFYLDGGPHPELTHFVRPGIDTDFIPNGMTPYQPE